MQTVILTKERKDLLGSYLSEQLSRAQTDIEGHISKWRECVDRYEAKATTKTFPWKGCSNVHIPLVPITIDAIKARIQNAIWAQPDQIITCSPFTEEAIPGLLNPETGAELTWRDVCDSLERYFNYEISPSGTVDFFSFIDRAIDELLLFGTVIAKATWEVQSESIGGQLTPIFDSFLPQVLPCENIRIPNGYPDLRRIPWISHRYVLRPSEIRARVQSHGWSQKAVTAFLNSSPPPAELGPIEEEQTSLTFSTAGTSFSTNDTWLAETWLRYDFGDGLEQRIVVDHALSDPKHIFRVISWPYENQQLPFFRSTYINRRGSFWAMGVAERIESLDEALSSSFNQMMDNVTIANTRVWSVNQDSRAMQALESIAPGQKIPRMEKDDILPLQAGEVYPSIFEGITLIRDYAERLSKLTDYNLGRESSVLGKQSTATTTLALLQESGQYFDNINRNFRLAFLNPIMQQWLDFLAQFQPLARIRMILGPMAEPVIQALSVTPPGQLRKRISIRIAFSNTAATRELARQEEIQKLQALQQYYQGLISLAQLRMTQPLLSPLVDSIARDSQYHITRLLDTYGEARTPSSIPPWDKLLTEGANLATQQPVPVGPDGSPIPSGMETPPGGVEEEEGVAQRQFMEEGSPPSE